MGGDKLMEDEAFAINLYLACGFFGEYHALDGFVSFLYSSIATLNPD